VRLQGLEEAAGLGGPVIDEFHRPRIDQIFYDLARRFDKTFLSQQPLCASIFYNFC
jgi:hypothetical protein